MAGKTFKVPAPVKMVLTPPSIDFTSGGADAGVLIQSTGLKALEENIMKLGPVFMNAAGFEMEDIAQDIIIDSQENYVPVLDDVLRPSAGWDRYTPSNGASISTIGMWYGAPTEVTHSNISRRAKAAAIGQGLSIRKDPYDYALDQHENLSYDPHQREHGAGIKVGSKYLERPFVEAEPTIIPRIAKAIDVALGGGFTGLAGTLSSEGDVIRGVGAPAENSLDAIADRLGKAPNYPGYGPGHK